MLPSLTTAAAVLSLSKRSAFPLLPLLMVSHTGVIFQKYRSDPVSLCFQFSGYPSHAGLSPDSYAYTICYSDLARQFY